MKKPAFFNRIDKSTLKKYPFQWIIGWHIFLPIILALILFAIALAFITPTKIFNYFDDDSLGVSSVFVGFLCFMAFVLFVIRQIKFNSFRIHHHIPYAKSKLFFFSFFIIIFLFSVISFIPSHIYTLRVKNEVNSKTDNFEKDMDIFCNTSSFFIASEENSRIAKLLTYFDKTNCDKNDTLTLNEVFPDNELLTDDELLNDKELLFDKHYTGIDSSLTCYEISRKLDLVFENGKVIINESPFYDYSYRNEAHPFPIKISKKEAITQIENFIKVAKKYDIELSSYNAEDIFNKRKLFNNQTEIHHFSLFNTSNIQATNYYNDKGYLYKHMMSSYKRQLYKSFDFEVLFGILIFSIILATLLWIFISVTLADFGFSILSGVLLMILTGIVVAIVGIFNRINDDEVQIAFFIGISIIYLIAFLGDRKKRLIRILKIVCHYLLPVFLLLVILEIDDSKYYELEYYYYYKHHFYYYASFFILGMIVGVFIFDEVYKKDRLLAR